MGKKANKASRKYAASGQLKKEIQSRKKHQLVKRKIERRKGSKGRGKRAGSEDAELARERRGAREDEEEAEMDVASDGDEEVSDGETGQFKGMSVDDFLKGGFMGGGSDDDSEEDNEASDEEAGDDDNASFASVDDLEDEAVAHKLELKKLAEQDPEFFKYLQENDRELLSFEVEGNEDSEEDDDVDMDQDVAEGGEGEEMKAPTLTKEILKRWQKAILEHRSLRALRRLLIAFRAAVHMNEEDQELAWTIDSPSVYEKLVTTSLRYTPIVLDYHVPCKKLPNGRFKPPTQTPKLSTVQKLILSFFHNVMHLMDQLTAKETLILAVNESAKLLPYVLSSRKAVKLYLKTCLKLWSSAEDEVRIAAFLAIRRLASSGDEAIRDISLKSTYLSLLRNARSTSAHTLPSINLMKNSASELFCEDHAAAYQHAFVYIRQLAVHLRNSMKVKSKDAFKQVYNWQFVHCIDFWAIVIAKACDWQAETLRAEESELKPLIYPLTQVALGSIKLISSSRSYPFHLHIIQSLIHLSRHTKTYIPLTPYLLPIITTTLAPTSRPKASTLKPLDLETHIRAPAQYVRTRIYNTVILEESTYLLAEWVGCPHVQGSIAFPELVIPLLATLRRSLKKAKSSSSAGVGAKEANIVKGLAERLEEGATWVSERRKSVSFGPKNVDAVRAWERDVKIEETPLGKYVKSQRKLREKRRMLVEKARVGEEEYLEE